jgi:hypothetical protein
MGLLCGESNLFSPFAAFLSMRIAGVLCAETETRNVKFSERKWKKGKGSAVSAQPTAKLDTRKPKRGDPTTKKWRHRAAATQQPLKSKQV